MVINNAKDGQRVILSKMFDKLESHLRSLESLGITTEQTTEFLYPMVKSCLLEDVLIVWQRSANYNKDGERENPPMTEMDFLLQFLPCEVESEEQRVIARIGFITNSERKKEKKHKNEVQTKGCPTAFGLIQIIACLFCNKKHASQDCFKAMNMTLSERKQKLKETNRCFACLRPNHAAKNCKMPVKCVICGKKHDAVMCDEIKSSKDQEIVEKAITTNSSSNNLQYVSASQSYSSNILFMTCLVRIN